MIDPICQHLADREFPASIRGYRDLLGWMRSHGTPTAVGVEGTGAYGAEPARGLTAAGVRVVDVDRPDRRTRRMKGKSDPIDAYAAGTAVASGRATGIPKSRDGVVGAVRVLRVACRIAVKAHTQAMNQIRNLLICAPAVLCEQVAGLDRTALIRTLARLRPGDDLSRPLPATRAALGRLARRHQTMDTEIAELDSETGPPVAQAAPALLELFGVGPGTAGQLLASAGDNPERMRSEGASTHLAGVAPIPAPSSGRPIATASTEAATGPRTTPSTRSFWSACATTSAPAPTSNAALAKDCRRRTSCAASSDSSPARSTAS